MTDKEILQSIIDNHGDCGVDNIYCVGCPLINEIRECKTPFLTAEREEAWNKDKLELAKKILKGDYNVSIKYR